MILSVLQVDYVYQINQRNQKSIPLYRCRIKDILKETSPIFRISVICTQHSLRCCHLKKVKILETLSHIQTAARIIKSTILSDLLVCSTSLKLLWTSIITRVYNNQSTQPIPKYTTNATRFTEPESFSETNIVVPFYLTQTTLLLSTVQKNRLEHM